MKSRGKPLDKKYGKYAEGYLLQDGEECCIAVKCEIEDGEIQDWHYEPIEPSTVEHKIGNKWYSVEELEKLASIIEKKDKEIERLTSENINLSAFYEANS